MTTDRFAEPQLFEVWRMAFRYEDQPEISGERPVIIGAVNKETDEVLLLTVKVTGHAPRSDCAGEVVLEDWQEAGLEKPSVARCSKHMVVPSRIFRNKRRYGKLSFRDSSAVLDALREVKALLL